MEDKVKQLETENLELKKQLFALNYKELTKQFSIEIVPQIFFESEKEKNLFDKLMQENNIKFKLDLTLRHDTIK